MSLGSRILFGLALAFVLLASCVNGHGWMSKPVPRGKYIGRTDAEEIAPAARNPNDPNFICRSAPAAPVANWISLQAGQAQKIQLGWNAKHPGGCFVYLSYDGDKPVDQMKWFKIWEQKNCIKADSYDVTIPDYLPSGDHVVFRWEWYGLHQYTAQPQGDKVEFYAQCVDAVLTGRTNGKLPAITYKMPGHLPETTYPNYWDAYNGAPEFLSGPALAIRPDGVPTDTLPPPPVAATNKPTTTQPPAATVAATVAPTQRPYQPPTTVAPSQGCTVGNRVCNADGSFRTCVPGSTWVTQVCPVRTTCKPLANNDVVCDYPTN